MYDNDQSNSKKNSIYQKLMRRTVASGPTPKAAAYFGANQASKIISLNFFSAVYTGFYGNQKTILFASLRTPLGLDEPYVGSRGFSSTPVWLELFDEESTRFEFESLEIAQKLVFNSLFELGLRTADFN